MPALAIPILIPFAEAAGITINAVASAAGLDLLSKKVEEYIEDNPEQSQKIFAMIMPEQGLANILKNKSSEGDEEVSEEELGEIETPKLTGKEKGKAMADTANSETGNYSDPNASDGYASKRGRMIKKAEDLGLANPDLKDNYKPSGYTGWKKFANKYKKKYADGGIASMMQPKRAGYAMGGMLSNLITSSPQILSQVNSNSQNNSNWWDTLDAQGMNVYNSMKRGGHDDSTIQDQLSMLGYYDPNTTPPDSTPDIPVVSPRNIINNGGNDKGGITAARPGLGYKGPGSTVSGNFNIEDIGEGTVDSDDLSFGLSLKEGIFGLQRMLGNIPTPLNLALKAANKFKNYRADKKAEAQVAQAAAEEAAAANRAEANRISNRLANEYSAQQQRDGRDFSVSGPDTSANPTGKSNQASSERGYSLHGKKGGFVPTGLATMFRRKR